MSVAHWVYLFIFDGCLGYLNLLVTVDIATMNMRVQISVWAILLLEVEITGLYVNSIFNFSRHHQTVFISGCTIFHLIVLFLFTFLLSN